MSFKTLAHDVVWRNGRIATMDLGSNVAYGLLENHDMVTRENKIVAIEPKGELDTANCKVVDLEGRLITPGLIDCHTHLVFGGNRAAEWEQRMNGVSYETISQQGGGINSTVRATRALNEDELYQVSQPRLEALIREGVTTIEMKSGYGLDLKRDRKSVV